MQYSNLKDLLPVLEAKIKVKFKNKDLLAIVFVHKSFINENRGHVTEDNERMEFLGDAVLELVTTEFLYKTFTDTGEGKLTTFRSALVKGKHLAEVARHLKLGDYLLLSRGEEKSGGSEKNYILANTLEALIGAIYLDRGFAAAHKFISDFIITKLGEILQKGLHIDAKSKLQELSQDRASFTPIYNVLSESGPDHNKTFEVGVYIKEKLVGKGLGSSKQKGEEEAAVDALKNLKW